MVERWTMWRQREALLNMHDSEFRASGEFAAMLEQFAVFHAPAIQAKGRKLGFETDTQEIVNLIFEALHRKNSKGEFVSVFAAKAENPWAYIGKALQQWASTIWGHRGVNMELAEAIPAKEETLYDGPTFSEVVPKVTDILKTRTPKKMHQDLEQLVWFLATNPPQRLSYEAFEREAALEYCPSFTYEQIVAVSNLVWGGRPRQSETSLMGHYLLDENWNYKKSASHMRALKHYENEILALAVKKKI